MTFALPFALLVASAAARPSLPADVRQFIGRAGATTHIHHRVWVAPGGHLEFHGTVELDDGSELVAGPGVTLSFNAGAQLIIGRNARIRLEGTALQPVVLTCTNGPRVPGCWNGVVINGHAPINIGPVTSPPARGNGAAGCREVVIGSPYGGCDVSDSSGVLRYVRIEYASTGLHLRGLGQGTVLANVQVHRSADDGIRIEGGTVRISRIWATANSGYGLVWTHGWAGAAQSLVVLQDPDASAGGVEGRNTDSGDPDALPRSAPRLYNVTVLAGSNQNNPRHGDPPPALRLARGTAGVLRNLLLYRPYTALDVDDDATCSQLVSGTLLLEHALVAAPNAAASPDVEPAACSSAGLGEAALLTRSSAGNSVVTDASAAALMMVRPDDSYAPDLRLRVEGMASSFTATSPPADGWFDVSARFVGAVPQAAAVVQSNIAWYMGWTVGGPAGAPLIPSSNFALRFHANVLNDLGRVKIALEHRSVNVGAGNFTIEFWVRGRLQDNNEPGVPCGAMTDAWIEGNILLDRDRFTRPRDYGLGFLSGRVAFGVRNAGDQSYTLCGTRNILDDQWHHVAVTRNASSGALAIFLDGVLDASASGPSGDVSYPSGFSCPGGCGADPFLVIGAEKHDVGPQYPGFNGFLDELRLSTSIRYAGTFAPPSARFATDAETAALYHFDEGSGGVTVDAAGSSPGEVRVGGSPAGPSWVVSSAPTGN